MKIAYTGTPSELLPKQKAKLESKLQKCLKSLERRGEKEVHVILSRQRHLHKVEITAHAYDHALAGAGQHSDLAIAMSDAIARLDRQVVKMQQKFRDGYRLKDKGALAVAPVKPAPAKPAVKAAKAPKVRKVEPKAPHVYAVGSLDGRKPMTVDEAMLEIGSTETYFMFRDARTDKPSVLMRRPDGHFDLIET